MWTRLQHAIARFRALFAVSELDSDLDEELDSHVAMLTDENIRRGMTEEEALRNAFLQVGSREATKELHREVRGLPFLETLAQDLRYTVRTLRRRFSNYRSFPQSSCPPATISTGSAAWRIAPGCSQELREMKGKSFISEKAA